MGVPKGLVWSTPRRDQPGDRDPYNKLKYLERDLVLAGGTAGECGAEVLVPHDELHYAAG